MVIGFLAPGVQYVNRRAKLTPYRRPKLTPLFGSVDGSARPGEAGRGCAAGAGAGPVISKGEEASYAMLEAPAFIAGLDDVAVMREAVQ